MKLRNKKTGEIIIPSDYTFATYDDGIRYGRHTYSSLAELNEEWKDYKEPEECEYWYIEADGEILQCHKPKFINHLLDKQKEIGNYFETEEEAKKAVERLRAWKRLKDAGIKFRRVVRYLKTDGGIEIRFPKSECWEDKQNQDDLNLLFGGKE